MYVKRLFGPSASNYSTLSQLTTTDILTKGQLLNSSPRICVAKRDFAVRADEHCQLELKQSAF